jgi:hypothetical protein
MNGKDNGSENNNAMSKDAAEKKPTIDCRKRECKSSRNIQQRQPQNQQDSNHQQRPRPPFSQKSQHSLDSILGPSSPNFGTDIFRSSYHLPLVKDSSHVPILIPCSPVVDGKPKRITGNLNPNNNAVDVANSPWSMPLPCSTLQLTTRYP